MYLVQQTQGQARWVYSTEQSKSGFPGDFWG